jgi:hypothetical protein
MPSWYNFFFKEDVDFNEVFSLVVKYSSFQVLCCYGCFVWLKVWAVRYQNSLSTWWARGEDPYASTKEFHC